MHSQAKPAPSPYTLRPWAKDHATVIGYTPAEVPVSDERGSLPGWEIVIRRSCGEIAAGALIPIEGDCPSCWGGDIAETAEERDALAEIARMPAGASGSIELESEAGR